MNDTITLIDEHGTVLGYSEQASQDYDLIRIEEGGRTVSIERAPLSWLLMSEIALTPEGWAWIGPGKPFKVRVKINEREVNGVIYLGPWSIVEYRLDGERVLNFKAREMPKS